MYQARSQRGFPGLNPQKDFLERGLKSLGLYVWYKCTKMYHFNTKTPQITVCCKTSLYFLYSFICTKFSKFILRKIIKIVAKRRQILSPKCTKFDVGWGSAQTPLGELTMLPQTTYSWI